MDLRDQIGRFRALLQDQDLDVNDFELNVNGDAFKELLAGGQGGLEVHNRISSVTIDYAYDGTPSWLTTFANDLASGKFKGSES